MSAGFALAGPVTEPLAARVRAALLPVGLTGAGLRPLAGARPVFSVSVFSGEGRG